MRDHIGMVLWFSGLSGSGKTTTAKSVEQLLRARGCRVERLDGDELRETVCKGLGFSREERMENIKRIVYIAKLLSRNGIIVLVSAITPYEEMRQYVRNSIAELVEIFVECPVEECERRDVKGLYAKARSGELRGFTGISDPFELPEDPDLVLHTAADSLDHNSNIIMDWLEQASVLTKEPSKGDT